MDLPLPTMTPAEKLALARRLLSEAVSLADEVTRAHERGEPMPAGNYAAAGILSAGASDTLTAVREEIRFWERMAEERRAPEAA